MPYTATAETRVNTYTLSRQSAAQSIALPDGGYITAWSGAGQADQGYGVWLQRFDASGVRVGGEVLVNTTTANSQRNPQIVASSSGGFAVVWDTTVPGAAGTGGVFAQTFDASGVRLGGEILISTSGNSQQVTALPDGGYVVTWTHPVEYPFSGVSARILEASGQARGPAFVLDNDQIASLSNIAATSNGFIAVWRSSNPGQATLTVQAFDSLGARVGEPYPIGRDGAQSSPEIVRLAGGFVVVWSQLDGLYGHLLTSDGRPTGAPFLAQATPSGSQLLHSVVATLDGGFAIAWDQFAGPSAGSVGLALFNGDGTRNGQTLTVRSGIQTEGEPPAITVLSSGDIIVSYARYVGDSANFFDVFQTRLHNTSGEIAGSSGADVLAGTRGDDILIGGRGDDFLDGGAGWDTAVFSGRASSYKIIEGPDGRYIVSGVDGRDTLTDVEQLRFDDRVVDLTMIVCRPPLDAMATSEKAVSNPSPTETLGIAHSVLDMGLPGFEAPMASMADWGW